MDMMQTDQSVLMEVVAVAGIEELVVEGEERIMGVAVCM